jgi:oligoendopeptidase F
MAEDADSIAAMLDVSKLGVYKRREFVPLNANLADPAQVKSLYERLLARPVQSSSDIEALVLDRSELEAAISQTETVLNIRMTCQTDDAARAGAYKHFVKEVMPIIKPLAFELDKEYLAMQKLYGLDDERYQIYDRNKQASVELFRPENVALQTQEDLLVQEYQTLNGSMTVQFMGKEYTLPQMAKFQLEPDRPLREEAWRATAKRWMQEKDGYEDLFDVMFAVRAKIAANAGCASYREYVWQNYHRFDYTPGDCKLFHEAVERVVVPMVKKIAARRREELGVDILRPWDMDVDTKGRGPLKPFETVGQFTAGVKEIFSRVEPAFGESFAGMLEAGLLDLASRKGKAPGGYQCTLNEAREPFIFMNAVGLQRDVETLLHEGGHAFHALAAANEPIVDYRHAPIEFCEVASMGMELIAAEHLDVFYNEEQMRRARKQTFEGILKLFGWIAVIDSFQHWMYESGCIDRELRKQKWIEIHQRFGSGGADWSGLEDERAYYWHRQLHIFQIPFYYIEYGIAQLGALQLWAAARRDPQAALGNYRRALSLGGSRRLPELFAAAGLKFDFTETTLRPLAEAVAEELKKIEQPD